MPTLCPFEREDEMGISPEKIKYQMNVNMLNNEMLAKETGLSPQTVSNLKMGKVADPRPSTMRALCAAFHCTPADLLETPK